MAKPKRVGRFKVTRRFQNGVPAGALGNCPYCNQEVEITKKKCEWCGWHLNKKVVGQ